MPLQTRSELRKTFSTGAQPTAQHYADRVDSTINQLDDGVFVSPEKNIGINDKTPDVRLSVVGDTKIKKGDSGAGGNLLAEGNITIGGDLNTGSSNSELKINAPVQIAQDLTINGAVQIAQTLNVTEDIKATGIIEAPQIYINKAPVWPAGAVMSFAMKDAPPGWLKCDGEPVSRTEYAALFAAIGIVYGNGDDSTTFNLPDLRGEFIRGWDDGRGVDPGRELGSEQDYDWKGFSMNTVGQNATVGTYSHGPLDMGKSTTGYTDGGIFTGKWDNPGTTVGIKWDDSELRPCNIALNYCIKY